MLKVLFDVLLDSVKLIPFLFVTYFIMELLEQKAGEKTQKVIEGAGKTGPLWGGILGVFPQCGFSTAASSLYAGRVITLGTLLAVFLSTSDEMLPIFISESVGILTILKILGAKAVIAVISGFLVEFVYRKILHLHKKDMDIHSICENEHCDDEDPPLIAAIKHTLKIFLYILILSLIIEIIVTLIGEEQLKVLFIDYPIVGEMVAGLVGLIPNCAASVVITELYLEGIIGAGAMMSGLLVGAGVGVLILFRLNKSIKENICIMATLYAIGVLWGVLISFLGITF